MIASSLSSDRTPSLTEKMAAIMTTSPKSPASRRTLTVALIVMLCCLVALQLWTTPIYKMTDEYISDLTSSPSPDTTETTDPSPSTDTDTDTDTDIIPTEAAAPSPIYHAVVIETQMTPNLIPLMLHFSSVLGPSWPILLFTGESSWETPTSPALQRALSTGAIQVRYLPSGTEFKNSTSVSQFLTQPWFWEQLQEADRVLLFQTDSVICSKSSTTIEDFVEYDFVGAPIAPKYGAGFNGGLSLRNPKLFLDIVREEQSFAAVPLGGETDHMFKNKEEAGVHKYEDQWFYKMVKDREGNLPSMDVARKFSVETVWYDRPLGYHQPKRWWEYRMGTIADYCPEVNMLIGRRAE